MTRHSSKGMNTRSEIRIERAPVPDEQKLLQVPIDLILRAADEYMTPTIRTEIATDFAPYIGRLQIPALAALQLIDLLCARCLTEYPLAEARRIIGANTILLYTQSVVVQALITALRLASIEHILQYLPRQFATAYNFGTYEMKERSVRHWRFTLKDYLMYPDVLQGQLEAGSRILHNDAQYQYTIVTPHHCYFDITWKRGRLPRTG